MPVNLAWLRVVSAIAAAAPAGLDVIVMLPLNSAEAEAGLGVEAFPSPWVDLLKAIPESPRDSSDPLGAVPARGTAIDAAVCFVGDAGSQAEWPLPVLACTCPHNRSGSTTCRTMSSGGSTSHSSKPLGSTPQVLLLVGPNRGQRNIPGKLHPFDWVDGPQIHHRSIAELACNQKAIWEVQCYRHIPHVLRSTFLPPLLL